MTNAIMNEDKLIELAKEAGFKVYQLPTTKEFEVHSIGQSFEIELAKFAELVLSQAISEPVVTVRHADSPYYTCMLKDFEDIPDGTPLYTHAQPTSLSANEQLLAELCNIKEAKLFGDFTVNVSFSSCRAASAFQQAITKKAE